MNLLLNVYVWSTFLLLFNYITIDKSTITRGGTKILCKMFTWLKNSSKAEAKPSLPNRPIKEFQIEKIDFGKKN